MFEGIALTSLGVRGPVARGINTAGGLMIFSELVELSSSIAVKWPGFLLILGSLRGPQLSINATAGIATPVGHVH